MEIALGERKGLASGEGVVRIASFPERAGERAILPAVYPVIALLALT